LAGASPTPAAEQAEPIASVLVKLLRRALTALGIAGVLAAALRVRGRGGVPPQHGGWRELPPT
jgi:hypothetical protein